MITASVGGTTSPSAASTKGTVWGRLAKGVAGALCKAKGMKSTPQQQRNVENQIRMIEDRYRKYFLAACQDALLKLRELTPKDSGRTAMAWDVEAFENSTGIDVNFNHPNKTLVDRLNYGSPQVIIRPRNRKVLAFTWQGKQIFAKYVIQPAWPALGFVDRVEEQLVEDVADLQQALKGTP